MVGMFCAVALCNNSFAKSKAGSLEISFHRFPTDAKVRNKWVTFCKRLDKFNPSNSFVCSAHFEPSDFQRDLQAELLGSRVRKKLKRGTIPHRNIPSNQKSKESATGVLRKGRPSESSKQKKVENFVAFKEFQLVENLQGVLDPLTCSSSSVETDEEFEQADGNYKVLYLSSKAVYEAQITELKNKLIKNKAKAREYYIKMIKLEAKVTQYDQVIEENRLLNEEVSNLKNQIEMLSEQ